MITKELVERNSPYGQININRLKRLERNLRKQLPNDYRQYLKLFNGASFKNNAFYIKDNDYSVLHNMYRLTNEADYFDLLNRYEDNKYYSNIGLLVIADDNTGNFIAINLNNNSLGSICFIDRDTEDSIVTISESFDDFVNNLCHLGQILDFEDKVEEIIFYNNVNLFSELLREGYIIETKDNYGRSLLERVVLAGRLDMIKTLLPYKPKLNSSLNIAKDNEVFFPETFTPIVEMLSSYKGSI